MGSTICGERVESRHLVVLENQRHRSYSVDSSDPNGFDPHCNGFGLVIVAYFIAPSAR
jgi:hypothetical protein